MRSCPTILPALALFAATAHADLLVPNIEDRPLNTWQSCANPACAGGLANATIGIQSGGPLDGLAGAMKVTLAGTQPATATG